MRSEKKLAQKPSIQTPSLRFSWWATILVYLLLVFGLASSQITSDDTFWQLQSGKYIAENRTFIHTDSFTLTADAPRTEHCWLHDIVLYYTFEAFQYTGISVWMGIMLVATAVVLIGAARVRGASYLTILLITLPAILITHWAWLARPQLWTFLLFAVFLFLIERYRSHADHRIFWLAPLMILWSNFHGGAILAFPVFGAYLVGEGIDGFFKRSALAGQAYKRLYIVLMLLVAATFVTPYGPHILKATLSHVFTPETGSLGHSDLRNLDWKSLTYADYPLFFFTLVITAVLFMLSWKSVAISHVILLAGLAFMSLKQGRHAPLFFFAVAAIFPKYAENMVRPLVDRIKPRFMAAANGVAILAGIAILFLLAHHVILIRGYFNTGLKSWRFPVQATGFIEEHQLPANLFNSYEWGGYLQWRLFPEYHVFWDGRNTSETTMADGAAITNGDPGWSRTLERYNINTIVVMPCVLKEGRRFGIIKPLSESRDLALVYADDFSLVFVRRKAVDKQWLLEHELPKSRILDTILSMATLIAKENPRYYVPYFEMFRVYNVKGEHRKALQALKTYLIKNPERDPTGEGVYRLYYNALYGNKKQGSDVRQD